MLHWRWPNRVVKILCARVWCYPGQCSKCAKDMNADYKGDFQNCAERGQRRKIHLLAVVEICNCALCRGMGGGLSWQTGSETGKGGESDRDKPDWQLLTPAGFWWGWGGQMCFSGWQKIRNRKIKKIIKKLYSEKIIFCENRLCTGCPVHNYTFSAASLYCCGANDDSWAQKHTGRTSN